MGFKIAIDGPAGSGKSSAAREVAAMLGFIYIDTGAMYRAVGLYAMRNGVSPQDENGVSGLLDKIVIEIRHGEKGQEIYLNGENVSEAVRSQEAAFAASAVAVFPAVREKLVALQRGLAAAGNIVMDGRDIGSYVLPDAGLKIYLDASIEIRAARRFSQLSVSRPGLTLEAVIEETRERDINDSGRKHSPLKKADDAVVIDNGGISLSESAAKIVNLALEKMG